MIRFFLILLFVLPFSCEAKEKICLNMIVKNESEVIKRCLDSVKPIIDYWVIVDTGSTDGTQQIIKDHMKDIPGELFERPWKNFGHNRTEALELAKGKGDYFLFMDADDWLTYESGFKLPPLTKDLYSIWRGDDNVKFIGHQFVKANLPWKWVGVWHETLSCDQARTSDIIEKVRYTTGSDGGSYKDPQKYVKAAQILEQGLKDEPGNTRYAFYIAESYKDAGLYAKAYAAYHKRIRMGGWDEEIYWSLLHSAHLERALGFPLETVISSFYRAHRCRPHRVEPIYHLAEIYNQQGQFALAYALIKSRNFIPKPSVPDIFVNLVWLEKFGIPMVLSVCSYHLGYYEESLAASNVILADENAFPNFKQQALLNRDFALAKIQETKSLENPKLRMVAECLDQYSKLMTERKNPEEILSTLLEIAKIQEQLEVEPEVIISTYKNASKQLPSSIDPLYHLACYYRKLRRYEEAYQAAHQAMKIQTPVKTSITDYFLLWEFSLCAWSSGKFQEAIDATLKLLETPGITEEARNNLQNNLTYFRPGAQIAAFSRQKWGAPPWEISKTPIMQEAVVPKAARPKLHVCAHAAHRSPLLEQLLESCRVHNIQVDVLGIEEPLSLGKKLKNYENYLKKLPEDDVVLFIDADDVLVLADEKTMIDKFLAMKAPVVMSVVTDCQPFPHLVQYYPVSPTKFKYVNAGSYMGYVGSLKKVYEDLSPIPDEISDQGLLSYYFLYHPHKFKLDYNCELFLTLYQVDKNELGLDPAKKTVKLLTTSSDPCIINGNGMGKELYQQIYNTIFLPTKK